MLPKQCSTKQCEGHLQNDIWIYPTYWCIMSRRVRRMPIICNENFTQEKQFYTSQRMTIHQIIRRNDGDVEMKVRSIWWFSSANFTKYFGIDYCTTVYRFQGGTRISTKYRICDTCKMTKIDNKNFYTAISRCTTLKNVYCKSYPKKHFKEEEGVIHKTEVPKHTKFSEGNIYKVIFTNSKDGVGKCYIGSTIKTLKEMAWHVIYPRYELEAKNGTIVRLSVQDAIRIRAV